MKMRQGAEIPDELVFKKVVEANETARVTIISREEMEMLLRPRPTKSWWQKLWRKS